MYWTFRLSYPIGKLLIIKLLNGCAKCVRRRTPYYRQFVCIQNYMYSVSLSLYPVFHKIELAMHSNACVSIVYSCMCIEYVCVFHRSVTATLCTIPRSKFGEVRLFIWMHTKLHATLSQQVERDTYLNLKLNVICKVAMYCTLCVPTHKSRQFVIMLKTLHRTHIYAFYLKNVRSTMSPVEHHNREASFCVFLLIICYAHSVLL